MEENRDSQKSSISNAGTPEEIGEFWDSHSLADHWDKTHEVEFEIRACEDDLRHMRKRQVSN